MDSADEITLAFPLAAPQLRSMRVYIPDMTEFFAWMARERHAYVVMRGFEEFAEGYPKHGAKEDVDLLVADAAIRPIRARYGHIKKSRGVKCDIYDVSGSAEGSYLGHAYYPPALAHKTLSSPRLWRDKFAVPDVEAHFLTLIYHIAYHKAERARMDISDEKQSVASKYISELEALKKELGISLPNTLEAFHDYLKRANFTMPYAHFAGSLQNDFIQHVKSYFMAKVVAESKGELNLFVIRTVAMQAKLDVVLIDELKKHYVVLAVKPIPLLTRFRTRNQMRGGKWRRGGWPCMAVVVYDPHPQPTTAEQRKVHPFVFNNRQFFKPALREWFTKTAGTNPKANPVHSTDNEAEALGHLNLFFTEQEQLEILEKVGKLRQEI